MALTVIKNWDNKTWLSSKNYINSFNKFLIKNIKINSKSRILDIGCGRGKILGSLSSKLRFKKKPLGIDIINHTEIFFFAYSHIKNKFFLNSLRI